MDTAGPGRSAEGRSDFRLSAARAGQSALLEAAAVGAATGQPSAAFVRVTPANGQLQPSVFPDGLFEKRAGRVRAIRAQKTAVGRPGRRLPLRHRAQNAFAHADAAAVPKAHLRGRDHGRADRHVVAGRGKFAGREQSATDR